MEKGKLFYDNDQVTQKQLVLEALGNPKCAHLTIYRQRQGEESIVRVAITQKDVTHDYYKLEWNEYEQKFFNIQKANIL